MPASLLVTDLDGTFWDNDRAIPKPHIEAVERISEMGIPILAATARRPRHVAGPFADHGLDLPFACNDGAIGIDGTTRFVDRGFSAEALEQCLALMAGHGVSPCLYVLDELSDIVMADNPTTCSAHRAFIADQSRSLGKTAVASLKVYAMSVLGVDKELLNASFDALSERTDVEAVLAPEPGYGKWALTLTPEGVDKWSAVEAFCEHRGLDPRRVVAVGDGANDVPLLRRAWHSVAVEGGHPEALAHADQTIGNPATNGWASLPAIVAALK